MKIPQPKFKLGQRVKVDLKDEDRTYTVESINIQIGKCGNSIRYQLLYGKISIEIYESIIKKA